MRKGLFMAVAGLMLAFVATQAMAQSGGDLGSEVDLSVSAHIASYAQVVQTDATIEFGDMDPLDTGWFEAPDMAQGTVLANVDVNVAYDNGPDLADGANTLDTENSCQITGGPITFNGGTFTMGPADWTPWGPSGEVGVVKMSACTEYIVKVRCRVMRQGLLDPKGNYTKTTTLTITESII